MQNTCNIEGCDKRVKIKYKGWCSAHYEKWRRLGDPLGSSKGTKGPKRPVYGTEKQCTICKEVKPLGDYYSRDTPKGPWYYKHCKECHSDLMGARRLEQRLKNPPKPKPKVDHGECAYEGCTGKAQVRLIDGPVGWYCHGHWTQWHTNKELRPVRAMKKSVIDERYRLCTSCNKVKTHEAFYMHSNGKHRQSVCKECTYPRARFNRAMNLGLYDQAAVALDEIHPDAQAPYRARLEEALAKQG